MFNGPLGWTGPKEPTAKFVAANANLKQFEDYCNLEFNNSSYKPQMSTSQNDLCTLEIMESTTDTQAVCLAGQFHDLLSKGFCLTKRISNSREVINSVPESKRAPSAKNLDLNKNSALTERAVGIQWNVQADTFSFKIASKEKPATRRGILSIVSSIYDPLSFISPRILPAKDPLILERSPTVIQKLRRPLRYL